MVDPKIDRQSAVEDFVETVVPLEQRMGSLTMTLFWITMMTGYPTVILGFEWCKSGFSLGQVLLAGLCGAIAVFLFTLCSAWLGATTGKTYSVLSRAIFGKTGSRIISTVWSGLFLLWYVLLAVIVADAVKTLLKVQYPVQIISVVFVLLMAINNIFRIKGVVNFARFLAAPVLIIWICSTLLKAVGQTSFDTLFSHSSLSLNIALGVISPAVIGIAVWGNEADFWRFGKPSLLGTALPILISIMLGEIIFPVTGWLVANICRVSDVTSGTLALNNYSFGSHNVLAALVLAVSLFAANDGNLYGAVNGLENLLPLRRSKILLGSVIVSMIGAVIIPQGAGALDFFASFTSFLLPCVTLIILFEHFIAPKIFHGDSYENSPDKSAFHFSAVIALLTGWLVGILASGAIPQWTAMHNGIWPLYAWFTSPAVYAILRIIDHKKRNATSVDVVSIQEETEPFITKI